MYVKTCPKCGSWWLEEIPDGLHCICCGKIVYRFAPLCIPQDTRGTQRMGWRELSISGSTELPITFRRKTVKKARLT